MEFSIRPLSLGAIQTEPQQIVYVCENWKTDSNTSLRQQRAKNNQKGDDTCSTTHQGLI